MSETFINPTPERKKYLVPFQIGSNKIVLYGAPAIMSLKSELINSLLDKLTDENVLAPNMEVNPISLEFLWSRLNGGDVHPALLKVDNFLNLWTLMNYFDINVNDKLISEYFNALKNVIPEVANAEEYKSMIDGILAKAKIISYTMYDELYKLVEMNRKEVLGIVRNLYKPNENYSYVGRIDLNDIDKDLTDRGWEILGAGSNKIVRIPTAGGYKDYTYPKKNPIRGWIMQPLIQ